MKLVIETQHQENYAAHDENYVHGTSDPRWKFKGGTTYVFPACDPNKAEDTAEFLKPYITCNNSDFKEYVLGWSVKEDNFETESQRMYREHGQGDTNYLDPEIWTKDGKVFQERGFVVGNHSDKAGDLHLWHDELFEGNTANCIGYFVNSKEIPLKGETS
jgi:hypothetical protein|tara:strand:+ start:267 stop:746 length:480 start_codon:yes stop_codon:yes gene_type:complete